MTTRHLTAAVLGCVVAGLTGCSTPEPALGGTTATVTIDGNDAGGVHAVRCRQTGTSWYIETPEKDRGFTAVLASEESMTAKSVEFRDLGGFTGNFWADNIGEAQVTGSNGKYTITGVADGNFADKPLDAATAKFRIQTSC